MTEEDWHRFLWGGDPQIITVCELPSQICRAIGVSSPIVRMHHAYALKCAQKHGLDAYEFQTLPITIDLGRCICDRDGHLTFYYFEAAIFGKWFHVSLKRDKTCTEVWVTTFHFTRHGEVARRCSKHGVIRPEKE